MMEVQWTDRNGELKTRREIFMAPGEPGPLKVELDRRYQKAMATVFAEGGTLHEIRQRKIGPNEPCPCGSKRKFKRCCKWKLAQALNNANGRSTSPARQPEATEGGA